MHVLMELRTLAITENSLASQFIIVHHFDSGTIVTP